MNRKKRMIASVLGGIGTLLVIAGLVLPARAEDKKPSQIISHYEKISEALVKDDLEAAKSAAAQLGKAAKTEGKSDLAGTAQAIAASASLKDARKAFAGVSEEVIELTEGQPGYFIMTCPMAKADWLQKDREVANPYMGQKMPACGKIKEGAKSGKKQSASAFGCCPMMRT